MYVDNAAMQLILNPEQFDVIVTGNLLGDISGPGEKTVGTVAMGEAVAERL